MIHILGNYYFESDGVRNFSLYKKGVISEDNGRGKKTNPENVGKEKFEPLGFYSSVESLLNGLIQKSTFYVSSIDKHMFLASISSGDRWFTNKAFHLKMLAGFFYLQ